VDVVHVLVTFRDLPEASSTHHNHLKIFSAPGVSLRSILDDLCALFCVLHMMFEAFGMSGRVDSPGC